MSGAIRYGLQKVPPDVDLVVGIPRSGLLAATIFSLYLNVPLTDLRGVRERRLLATGKRFVRNSDGSVFDEARCILVIDDCVSQGTEMRRARKEIADLGYTDRALFLSVYSFPEHSGAADIVLEVIPRPACFEWSCMHSPLLSKCCVDIDGVLCADTEPGEDDDGARYRNFLQNVSPLFKPSIEIGWLVTCRLEKYRDLTELWLRKNGIKYKNLIMMDYPTKQAREAARQHASFKARIYRETGAALFIESGEGLSKAIAEESGLPVMCLNAGALANKPVSNRLDIAFQRAQWFGRRLRRAPSKFISIASRLLRP